MTTPTAKKKIVEKPVAKTVKTKAPVKKVVKAKEVAHKVVAPARAPVKSSSSKGYVAAVGRRKSAIARVRLWPNESGNIIINGVDYNVYFSTYDYQLFVMQPLKLLSQSPRIEIKVLGGGKKGQAEAVRHGIARALLIVDEGFRKQLRTAGFLTRDARVKERKKYGLKKARRAPQFSKR